MDPVGLLSIIPQNNLNLFSESVGFALPNLAALAEISVAGAIQTGSHGSGLTTGNLATQLRSLQIVLANGSIAEFGPNDSELKAIAVGLGAFGVITQVELKLEPTYNTSLSIFQKSFFGLVKKYYSKKFKCESFFFSKLVFLRAKALPGEKLNGNHCFA